MRTVSVIGFDGALASAITGIIDLFRLAGVTWARINNETPAPQFATRLLTRDGVPCRCINGLTIQADGAWNELGAGADPTDLVVIPTIGGPIEAVLSSNGELIEWLGRFGSVGSGQVRVASNCTGAFMLAEAGLLEGRVATTHWGSVSSFGSVFRRWICNRTGW